MKRQPVFSVLVDFIKDSSVLPSSDHGVTGSAVTSDLCAVGPVLQMTEVHSDVGEFSSVVLYLFCTCS